MSKTLIAKVQGIELKATLFEPLAPDKNITLFCLPGGGLTKDYFNLANDFSFTARMTSLGYSVITMDHPGIATNALRTDIPYYTPRQSAAYLHLALESWIQSSPVIGVGHSMGGMMVMLMQGNHSPFKAMALFGSSAGGLDWGLSEDEKKYINDEASFNRDLVSLSLAKFGGPFTQAGGGPSGESITFGGETVELTKSLRDISCEMHSASAMMSMMRGSFRSEVEAIDVPMFFAFGDHDIGIPPEEAPKDFTNAASTKLVVLENTGHNHFAFSSIKTLCEKLDYWASNLD